MVGKPMDMTKEKYGKLLPLKMTGERRGGNVMWCCKCDCGSIVDVQARNLKSGNTQSCGCLQRERASEANITHGACISYDKHPLYGKWDAMMQRCYNADNKRYADYGGRGIRVCKAWHKYENFKDYMLSLPNCPNNVEIPGSKPDREIDRYPNNNSNYEPGNVRWATRKQQVLNTRRNRMIVINGVEMVLMEAVEKYACVSYNNVVNRLKLGWSNRDAFLTPLGVKP